MPRENAPKLRRRARRPAECREVDAVQPHHRLAPGDRRADRRHDARFARAAGRLARRAVSSCSTPAGCSARARIRCTSWSSGRGSGRLPAPISWCFVVDGREGLVPGDERDRRASCAQTGRPVIARHQQDRRQAGAATSALEFYQLGFEPVLEISAEHGHGRRRSARRDRQALGTGARGREPGLEAAADAPDDDPAGPAPRRRVADETSVAIVGRPNVGKSSLVNRLLREERVLVSEMPGTTRDAIDAVLTWHRRRFRIVDTAGMRRPGRVARRRAGGAGQRRRREEGDRRRRRRRAA